MTSVPLLGELSLARTLSGGEQASCVLLQRYRSLTATGGGTLGGATTRLTNAVAVEAGALASMMEYWNRAVPGEGVCVGGGQQGGWVIGSVTLLAAQTWARTAARWAGPRSIWRVRSHAPKKPGAGVNVKLPSGVTLDTLPLPLIRLVLLSTRSCGDGLQLLVSLARMSSISGENGAL